MAYTAWSVVFGEQPSASKWNQLGTNDAGFKDATNIDDDAILARHIADGAIDAAAKLASNVVTTAQILDSNVTSAKLGATVAFSAARTTTQTIGAAALTKVQLATEGYDYGSNFDAVTNFRFVAPYNGVYHFDATATITLSERYIAAFFKNGAEEFRGTDMETSVGSGAKTGTVSADLYLVATDYIEFFFLSDDGGDINPARMTGHLVGRTA